jgi:hypothetical protein
VVCCVLEEVHERLAEHCLVDLDRYQLRIDIDLDKAATERRARGPDRVEAELIDGHAHEPGAQDSGLDPGRVEQVRKKPHEPFGLVLQIGEHRVPHTRFDIWRSQCCCDRRDRRHGRAEVVREGVQERTGESRRLVERHPVR